MPPELSQSTGCNATADERTFSDRSIPDKRIPPRVLPTRFAQADEKTPTAHAVQPVFLYAHPVTNKTGGKDQKPMVK